MSCPAEHKYLFTGIVHFYGFAGLFCKKAAGKFHWVCSCLNSKACTKIWFFNPNFSYIHSHNHGNGTLYIMGRLGAAGKGEIASSVKFSNTALHFKECTILTFVFNSCGFYDIALFQPFFNITKLLVNFSSKIAFIFFMELGSILFYCIFYCENSRQNFILHLD